MANEAAKLVDKKITLDMMWDVAAALATEIETGQEAMVKAGLRTAPEPGWMSRAKTLTAVCRFIEVVREVEPELRALVARRRGWAERKTA
jgi:hypothetical protein